jgi:hypothetical protein
MITAEDLEAMNIEEIKANFSALMGGIVTAYGDDQEETGKQEEGEANAK